MLLAGLVTQAVVSRTVLDRAIVRIAQGYAPVPAQVLDDVEYLLQDTERVMQYEKETRSMVETAAQQRIIGPNVQQMLSEVVKEMQRRTYMTPHELMVEPTVRQMLKWAPKNEQNVTYE